MQLHGSPTPKPTLLYSSMREIAMLDLGVLSKQEKQKRTDKKLTRYFHYVYSSFVFAACKYCVWRKLNEELKVPFRIHQNSPAQENTLIKVGGHALLAIPTFAQVSSFDECIAQEPTSFLPLLNSWCFALGQGTIQLALESICDLLGKPTWQPAIEGNSGLSHNPYPI